MSKDDRYCYTYDELMERLNRDVPDKIVILQRSVCLGRHEWKLET